MLSFNYSGYHQLANWRKKQCVWTCYVINIQYLDIYPMKNMANFDITVTATVHLLTQACLHNNTWADFKDDTMIYFRFSLIN